jgi:hypothetical protein
MANDLHELERLSRELGGARSAHMRDRRVCTARVTSMLRERAGEAARVSEQVPRLLAPSE